MSKVMLVEDDDSLREIYSIRLTAEGYAIVTARDGEEALAVAVKERPDLIVSDVMMPKISGFDMLDILRSTPETQNIKVIMMTALSSEDQRVRGENLGADRYLVKSQVGIEDVVNVVHDVLGDRTQNGIISATVAQGPVSQAVAAEPGVAMAVQGVPGVAMQGSAPEAVMAAQSAPVVPEVTSAGVSAAPGVVAPVPAAPVAPAVMPASGTPETLGVPEAPGTSAAPGAQ